MFFAYVVLRPVAARQLEPSARLTLWAACFDRFFVFYHSNCKAPGIVGITEVVAEGYPDHTAVDPEQKYYDPKSDPENPRWFMADVRYLSHLKRNIALSELKQYAEGPLEGLPLLRKGNRLSIIPVTPEQWDFILTLESLSYISLTICSRCNPSACAPNFRPCSAKCSRSPHFSAVSTVSDMTSLITLSP
jgi:predicted RNA-binding protein with PUA-like domain